MQKLEIELPPGTKGFKELQGPGEHRIARCLGGQRHIETPVAETPLEFHVSVESCLSLAHRGLDQQDAGTWHLPDCLSNGPLERSRS